MITAVFSALAQVGWGPVIGVLLVVAIICWTTYIWRAAARAQRVSERVASEFRAHLGAQLADLTARIRQIEHDRLTDEHERGNRMIGVLDRLARLWGQRRCLAGHDPREETVALEPAHKPTAKEFVHD